MKRHDEEIRGKCLDICEQFHRDEGNPYKYNKPPSYHPASWMIIRVSKEKPVVTTKAPFAGCHGGLQTRWDKPPAQNTDIEDYMVTSNMDYEPGNPQRQEYINFLLGEKSPWKKLLDFGHYVHYHEDGSTCGISFFIEDIPQEYRAMIKGFFVAARMARERPAVVDRFAYLLEEGCDPRVAMLIAHDFHLTGNGSWKTPAATYHNGCHWPLSIIGDAGFNPFRFFSGDMNSELAKEATELPFSWSDTKMTRVNCAFGEAASSDRQKELLNGEQWVAYVLKHADAKENKCLFSTTKMSFYTNTKNLIAVVTEFFLEKGVKI